MPYALSIAFLTGITFIVYFPEQSDFHLIFPPFALLFAIYAFFISGNQKKLSLRYLIGLALFCRFIAIFAFPNLSDDIYRFIWDGQLTANHLNPYHYLPADIIDRSSFPMEGKKELYELLNSKHYYSVYPPLSQLIFYISSILSGGSWMANNIFLKLFIVAAECGNIYLMLKILGHFKKDRYLCLIYALNPLVIIETSGNLHFEGIMVFFFLLFTWFYIKEKKAISMIWLSLSIATKLVPLIFLPFIVKKMGVKSFLKYGIVLTICLMLIFTPLYYNINTNNFLSSIDLYFKTFEFNASIYYILRFIGYQFSGYNLIAWIGPFLGIITFLLIINKARKKDFPDFISIYSPFLWAFTIFLFLSTTIHPWYLILPISLAVFSFQKYILMWSFLIFMTYFNYSYPSYHENLWLVFIEYSIVWTTFFFERRNCHPS